MSNGPTVEDPNSPVGQISGTQQGLAQFAGPYVTEMLGKGMALADKPLKPTPAHSLLVLVDCKNRLLLVMQG